MTHPYKPSCFTFSKLPIDIGIGVKLDFWFSGAGDHKFWKLVCHLRDARDLARNVLQIISCSTSNLLLNRIQGVYVIIPCERMQIMLTSTYQISFKIRSFIKLRWSLLNINTRTRMRIESLWIELIVYFKYTKLPIIIHCQLFINPFNQL